MGFAFNMDISDVDILIIGAGLSGINAGYRIQKELPHKSFTILEGRSEVGGTWSFWKYPGIRSDSTMRVFGLPWYPWPSNIVMADGPVIRQYLEDAATSQGLDKKIHLNHRVTACDWSSAENRWTVSINLVNSIDGSVISEKKIKAHFIINAAGYYSYDKPLPVSIPGLDKFSGRVIHPQFWDRDTNGQLEFSSKRVVIIGSGATAITLLPAIAKSAAKVTLLQRSPSYVFSLDGQDHAFDFWRRFFPESWAKTFHWWQCLIMESFFRVLLSNLLIGKRLVRAEMRKQLPKGFDLDTHFNPSYPPFEQRLCFCPDADFFRALSQPNAEIVTGTIETVTSTGINLNPGAKSSSTGPSEVNSIPCDVIITATGLYVDIVSSLNISVSTLPSDPTHAPEQFNLTPELLSTLQTWNGTMIESLPNQGKIVGYTAGTWTPGANARTSQLINVVKHMDLVGAKRVFPVLENKEKMPKGPVMPNSSSYLVDARSRLPMAAGKGPWRNAQSVWEDWFGIWRTWVPVWVASLFGLDVGVKGLRFLGGEDASGEGRKDK